MRYFHANRRGIAQVAMSREVERMCFDYAERVRDTAAAMIPDAAPGDVVAERYDFQPTPRAGDRAAASVVIRLPNARLLQARDGVLTRAAAAHGAEVKSR